jgi:hypothetical protein
VKQIALFVLLAGTSFAGEFAILQNGFRIAAIRHELVEGIVRLETEHGSMDLPASQVVRFEQEEYVAPKPKPAEVATVVSPAPAEFTPEQALTDAASKHGLRPEFVRSVAAVESAFKEKALSSKLREPSV